MRKKRAAASRSWDARYAHTRPAAVRISVCVLISAPTRIRAALIQRLAPGDPATLHPRTAATTGVVGTGSCASRAGRASASARRAALAGATTTRSATARAAARRARRARVTPGSTATRSSPAGCIAAGPSTRAASASSSGTAVLTAARARIVRPAACRAQRHRTATNHQDLKPLLQTHRDLLGHKLRAADRSIQ